MIPRAGKRGRRFLNPDGSAAGQPLWQVARMLAEGKGAPWPAQVPVHAAPLPVPGPGQVAITMVGHATCLIRTPDITLLTDPIWSERCSPLSFWGPKRVRAPGIAWEDLPRIDAVLVSHAHYDHMDRPTLQRLWARDRPAMVTGLGNAARFARWGMPGATELDWGQEAALPGGARAIFTPARHFAARGLHDKAHTLWGGFAITLPCGFRLCFVADTAWGGHLDLIGSSLGPFDAALVPIGAYEPHWFMQAVHITPEQAVAAHHALRAQVSLAIHHGVFKLTQEAIDEPEARLAAAREGADFRAPAVGETVMLGRGV